MDGLDYGMLSWCLILAEFLFSIGFFFLDSQGDLQEKPVINGQMTENLKQTTGQTTERTVENGKKPINAPE